jgi:hypothetical protein
MASQEKDILEKLKEILLEDERDKFTRFEKEVMALRGMLNDNELMGKINPVVEKKFEQVRQEINRLSSQDLTKAIREQINNNRDEMIDSLYPIIGRLVQKYIQVELEKLADSINRQIDNTFTWAAVKREFLSIFGFKENNLLLKNALRATVEEVFLIEQNSGLLVGQYSKGNSVDQDMIAGMLTAIKSFVEDSFAKTDGNLNTIEYGNLKIIIQDYRRFYIVAVVSGIVDAAYKSQLLSYMLSFGEKHLAKISEDQKDHEAVSLSLTESFQNFYAEN